MSDATLLVLSFVLSFLLSVPLGFVLARVVRERNRKRREWFVDRGVEFALEVFWLYTFWECRKNGETRAWNDTALNIHGALIAAQCLGDLYAAELFRFAKGIAVERARMAKS